MQSVIDETKAIYTHGPSFGSIQRLWDTVGYEEKAQAQRRVAGDWDARSSARKGFS